MINGVFKYSFRYQIKNDSSVTLKFFFEKNLQKEKKSHTLLLLLFVGYILVIFNSYSKVVAIGVKDLEMHGIESFHLWELYVRELFFCD